MKCPNGHEVSDNVKFCPTCGAAIVRGNKYCTKCGNERKGTEKFCSQCGTPFETPIDNEPIVYEEEQPKSGFKRYLPYILGAFVVLAIIGYFNSEDSNNGNNSTNTVAVDSVSIDSTANPSTKEIITKRLEEIFKDVAKGNAKDCDERYFSSDFKKVYKEVADIDERFAQEGSIGFWDYTFWEMTQGDGIMSVDVKDVYNIKDKEATAKLSFKYSYDNAPSEYKNEDIKVVLENGKWVLDDLHGYKKQMKAFVEENKDYQPSTSQDKIDSSSGNDYSSNSSNTSSYSKYVGRWILRKTTDEGNRMRIEVTLRNNKSGENVVFAEHGSRDEVLVYEEYQQCILNDGVIYMTKDGDINGKGVPKLRVGSDGLYSFNGGKFSRISE